MNTARPRIPLPTAQPGGGQAGGVREDTFQETAGALNVVSATDPAMLWRDALPAAVDLENGVAPFSDPSRSVTAQLSADYGNPIAQAGAPISFDASDGCTDQTPTLSSAQGGVPTQGSFNGGRGVHPAADERREGPGDGDRHRQPDALLLLPGPVVSETPDTNGIGSKHGSTEVCFKVAPTLATQLTAQFTDSTSTSPDYHSQTQAVTDWGSP